MCQKTVLLFVHSDGGVCRPLQLRGAVAPEALDPIRRHHCQVLGLHDLAPVTRPRARLKAPQLVDAPKSLEQTARFTSLPGGGHRHHEKRPHQRVRIQGMLGDNHPFQGFPVSSMLALVKLVCPRGKNAKGLTHQERHLRRAAWKVLTSLAQLSPVRLRVPCYHARRPTPGVCQP